MIPLSTKKTVRRRSCDLCEFCGTSHNLQMAHIMHRKMGGRHGIWKKIINDPRNIAHLCLNCHDVFDGRAHDPIKRIAMRPVLQMKTGWFEWARESNLCDTAQGGRYERNQV